MVNEECAGPATELAPMHDAQPDTDAVPDPGPVPVVYGEGTVNGVPLQPDTDGALDHGPAPAAYGEGTVNGVPLPPPRRSDPAQIELTVMPGRVQPVASSSATFFFGLVNRARKAASSFLAVHSTAPGASASSEDDDAEESICPICMAERPTFAPECGHALCATCAAQYLRGALGDASSQVFAQGVRCPMHSSGCDGYITCVDAPRLLSPHDAREYATLCARGDAQQGERRIALSRPSQPHGRNGLGDLTRLLPAAWLGYAEQRLAPRFPSAWAFLTGGSRPGGGGGSTSVPEVGGTLSLDEVRRLHRFSVRAAVPEAERAFCPNCLHLVLLPPEKIRQRERDQRRTRLARRAAAAYRWAVRLLRQTPSSLCHLCSGTLRSTSRASRLATCPHCEHQWDVLELARASALAGHDERATLAYILLTTKRCPNPACSERISHFHGHACHHISPSSDGCPRCHQHFCYVCRRPHGPPGDGYQRHRRCPHGSSYCSNANILAHLRRTPYPHDARCGCPMCPHCRPGRPCEQCDGQCVVCVGLVPPGPNQLTPAQVRATLRPWTPWSISISSLR